MSRQIVTLPTTLIVLLVSHFGLDAATAAEPPAKSATIFAPTSFWYTPLPADVPLHPNSANFVAEYVRQKKAYYGTVSINLMANSILTCWRKLSCLFFVAVQTS